MMLDPKLLLPLLAGLMLGVVFFSGLWWTVQRAVTARWGPLWFFASLALRTVIVLGGFYLTCGDEWQRWLAALLGFGMARVLVTQLTRPQPNLVEGSHASQP